MTQTTKSRKGPQKSLKNSKAYWRNSSGSRIAKINQLILSLCCQKAILHRYLLEKLKTNDLHAVGDAAVDMREIDSKIEMLEAAKQI